MKVWIVALALTLFAGCHTAHPLTRAQVLAIISDAGFGVSVGCDAEWLEPPVCAVARRVLDDARLAAVNSVDGWQAAAKAVLVSEEARLSADSKIRPYVDVVISLL